VLRDLYPDLRGPRVRAVARDALTLLLLAGLAWLGFRVKHAVDGLAVLGTGVADAGSGIRSGFLSAASVVGNVPLAGDALSGALRSAAGATGGNLVAVGHTGESDAHHLGTILGLLMWGVPSLLLLGLVLPRRLREIRELRALRLALRAPNAEARRRLLALRAVMTMPDELLFSHSADPAGDLLAGRYEPLAAAALEAGGVSPSSGSAHNT
jgi:hypothetical protein